MNHSRLPSRRARHRALPAALFAALLLLGLREPSTSLAGTQSDLVGPAGSGTFGTVTVLPSGNIVVVDANYDAPGPIANVGAVYLYNGATGALISMLTGSTDGDQVGLGGVTVLTNGNYVVRSPNWDAPGPVADVGAVTWGNRFTGVAGVVSDVNSLVGSTADDLVGNVVTALGNGNYVVRSFLWDAPGPVANAGAVTWGLGTTGVAGVVTDANSLVGSSANDQVGLGGLTVLGSGNYAVRSPSWDAPGPVADVGAVTWGSGALGVAGAVSATNSLVGSSASDSVGGSVGGVTVLTNGNYVVASPRWDAPGPVADAGAVTWGSATAGVAGAVTDANSLVGSTMFDSVGIDGVTALTNGNYVVRSTVWNAPGPVATVGAVTWGLGTMGVVGAVTDTNSLVGSTDSDLVGSGGVTALTNGNYVVRSPNWDAPGPVANVGAVTWGSGTTGVAGAVTDANSLVGSTALDTVGSTGVTALTNGNYVVLSREWDAPGPVADVGAVTWGLGTTGVAGAVTDTNSLVGSTAGDRVGNLGVTALTNGNYVVASQLWDAPGPVVDVGAVTWGLGTTGVTGAVTAANSLVGSTDSDLVGSEGVTVLTNGNYVVASRLWNAPGPVARVGAVTWGSGTTGVSGAVSAANSLVGSSFEDVIGNSGVTALRNGNYVVASQRWDGPGPVVDVGAVTWGSGTTGVAGVVTAANSLVGTTDSDFVSSNGVTALTNGNYVVRSPNWDAPGPVVDVGAVTWGSGTTGVVGAVSPANSLVGSTAGDQNSIFVMALTNGNYVVRSLGWDAPGPVVDVGAVTLGAGCDGSTVGPIGALNSVIGATAGGGGNQNFRFDTFYLQLVVGRPADNTVSLFVADDRDADCVDDAVEDGAPNGGDGNTDFGLDKFQGNVTSLPNAVDGDYLTLEAPLGLQLTAVAAVPNPAPADPAIAGVAFPVGFVEFQLFPMPAPPSSVVVSLLLENAVAIDQYWRYGPESAMPADHWYRFDPVGGAPATGATMVSGTQVALTFVDGARGDDDLAANTILVDQGGPGGGPPPTATPPPTGARLARFDGLVEPTGQVQLTWETLSEADIAGFHVERRVAADAGGGWARVNPALIPARGEAAGGALYRLADRVDPGDYGYRLVVVEFVGPPSYHGPVVASVAAIRAFLPAAWRGWR